MMTSTRLAYYGGRHHSPRPTAAVSLLTRLVVGLAVSAALAQSATHNVLNGQSIQDALDIVSPGDTIVIHPGNYFEDIKTKVDGTENARITVKGSEDESNRGSVVLRGEGTSNYVFEIKHDYYIIENFSIDGKALDDANDDNYLEAYRNKLIYAYANRETTTGAGGYRSALHGLIIRDMNLLNAGAECVRLRYFVTYAEIYRNDILNCGIYDFYFNDGGKNGEGIYVGTSSNQWNKNYEDEPDETRGVHIYNNRIETNGNEGVDIKEGCIDTIIEHNEVYMQKDANAGGIDSRADGSIIRNNYIEDATGAGIRLGGHYVDGYQYGVNNQVYGNTLVECTSYGLKIMESPQEKICGNTIYLPEDADEDEYQFTGGDYKDDYDAREPCDDAPSPVPPSPTTAPTEDGTTPNPVPVATPAPTEPNAVYLDCFEDQKGARTMSGGYTDKENLTNEACIEYCKEEGKSFAGTFRGTKCRCTNTEWKVDRHGPSDTCTKKCPGDESQMCGGKWAVSSWRTGI